MKYTNGRNSDERRSEMLAQVDYLAKGGYAIINDGAQNGNRCAVQDKANSMPTIEQIENIEKHEIFKKKGMI